MRQTSASSRLKPTILTRRLVRDTAGDSAVVLFLLLSVYAAVDLVELNTMVGHSAAGLLYTYLFKLPTAAALLLPLAVALGGALRYARLRQTGEWEALQSAGISPLTTYRRLLAVSGGAVIIGAALSLYLGPLGTAHFETRMRGMDTATPSACAGGWTKQTFGFIRFDCEGQVDTVIELDVAGRPVARYAGLDEERSGDQRGAQAIWDVSGWHKGRGIDGFLMSETVRPPRPPAVNNLWGQSLTYTGLEQALKETAQMGLSADGLRAERALRIAAITACFLVPAVVTALLFGFGGGRTGRAVMTGIVVTSLYWSMCAAAWNGVAAGVFSEGWLSLGVPTAFATLSGAGWMGWKRRNRC